MAHHTLSLGFLLSVFAASIVAYEPLIDQTFQYPNQIVSFTRDVPVALCAPVESECELINSLLIRPP